MAIGVVRGSIVKNGAVGAEAVLGGDLLHETLALARLVVANSEELLADLLRSVDGDARAVTAHDPVWVRSSNGSGDEGSHDGGGDVLSELHVEF